MSDDRNQKDSSNPLSVDSIRRELNRNITGDPEKAPTKEEWDTYFATRPQFFDYVTLSPGKTPTPEEAESLKKAFEHMREVSRNFKVISGGWAVNLPTHMTSMPTSGDVQRAFNESITGDPNVKPTPEQVGAHILSNGVSNLYPERLGFVGDMDISSGPYAREGIAYDIPESMLGNRAVVLAVEELKDFPTCAQGNRADIIFDPVSTFGDFSMRGLFDTMWVIRLTGIALSSYEELAELLAERRADFVMIEGVFKEVDAGKSEPLTREESLAKTILALGSRRDLNFPLTYAEYKFHRLAATQANLLHATKVIEQLDEKGRKFKFEE